MRGRKVCRSVRAVVYVGLVGVSVAELLLGQPAWAVTFETMNGAPVQMQPYVDEPGAPAVTVPLGTSQPFSGLSGSAGSGSGSTGGGTEALNTMLGTPWGSDAASAAMAVGVNPSALAATCVVESECRNVGGSGTVSGAFQMTNSTYTALTQSTDREALEIGHLTPRHYGQQLGPRVSVSLKVFITRREARPLVLPR